MEKKYPSAPGLDLGEQKVRLSSEQLVFAEVVGQQLANVWLGLASAEDGLCLDRAKKHTGIPKGVEARRSLLGRPAGCNEPRHPEVLHHD